MANSVVTPTVTAHFSMGKWDFIVGTIAIAAGDYPTGGLTVSFANNPEIKSNSVPTTGSLFGTAGYIYRYVAGATKDIGKIMIFEETGNAGPLGQLAAAATPAAVVADPIAFFAFFPLLR